MQAVDERLRMKSPRFHGGAIIQTHIDERAAAARVEKVGEHTGPRAGGDSGGIHEQDEGVGKCCVIT